MSNIMREQTGTKRAGKSVGGQFKGHENSEASGAGLLDESAPDRDLPLTPEQVRHPDFSFASIDHQWPDAVIQSSTLIEYQGHQFVEHRLHPQGEYARPVSVTFDEHGDVARVSDYFAPVEAAAGAWLEDDDLRDHLQAKIRARRLAEMGVMSAGLPNDGGYTGYRFTGARTGELDSFPDAAQVSKMVRQDVKRAVQYGALPDDVAVRVRTSKYSGGQSVTIEATMPEGTTTTRVPRGRMSDEDRAYWERTVSHRPSIESSDIRQTLSAIGNQWNDTDNDAMTDYFSSSYHLLVQFRDGAEPREPRPLPPHAAAH